MKRDMDLVREILQALEADETDATTPIEIEIPGRSEREITYHLQLLDEGGLVEALNATDKSGPHWLALRLTWKGHEFLDMARDATMWAAAKRRIAATVGSVSLDVLTAVMRKLVLEQLT